MSRIAYDRSLSPTAAAVKFFNALKDAGKPVSNLGQGREIEDAPDAIFPQEGMPAVPQSGYNPTVGGTLAQRGVAAAHLGRFLGIQCTAANTFVVQANGRDVYANALNFAATKINPNGTRNVLPDLRWPMYDDINGQNRGLGIDTYDNPGRGDDEQDGIDLTSDDVAITLNTPHNPTGRYYTEAFMKNQAEALETRNRDGGLKTALLLDIPYFYALPRTAEGSDHYLDGGFEHLTNADAATPWFAAVSFSKALGTANMGLTFVVVHPEYAQAFARQLTSRNGMGYTPGLYEQVERVFAPEFDQVHLDHYAALREKYGVNFEKTVATFGGELMVDGDPGMTALLKLPNMKGKVLQGSDGEAWPINDTADFLEYLGNEHNVVAVDNGMTEDDEMLIRVALAPKPQNFAPAIERVFGAYTEVAGTTVAQHPGQRAISGVKPDEDKLG